MPSETVQQPLFNQHLNLLRAISYRILTVVTLAAWGYGLVPLWELANTPNCAAAVLLMYPTIAGALGLLLGIPLLTFSLISLFKRKQAWGFLIFSTLLILTGPVTLLALYSVQ